MSEYMPSKSPQLAGYIGGQIIVLDISLTEKYSLSIAIRFPAMILWMQKKTVPVGRWYIPL